MEQLLLGSSFYLATHVIFTAMPRNLVEKARIKPNAILYPGVAAATTSEPVEITLYAKLSSLEADAYQAYSTVAVNFAVFNVTPMQSHLNSTLPSTFSVIGETWLNEINELRWFLC